MESSKFSKELPGVKVDLPPYILQELSLLHPKLKRGVSFFGGHPASITKQSTNEIFSTLNQFGQSPYLVCQKTDGVRYILLIAFVNQSDYISISEQTQPPQNQSQPQIQCYLISREGQRNLVAYAAHMNVGHHWKIPQHGDFKNIITILDGQMIQDLINKEHKLRYLAFDALVHLGANIIDRGLKERLECIKKFIQYNKQLILFEKTQNQGVGKSTSHQRNRSASSTPIIEIILKDFYRLTLPRYNTSLFMLQKYRKLLPHENDGLIFNHEEKDYVIGGTNNGYIKWKPAELNTLDFMIVPNLNLCQKYGSRVLDLYLGAQHPQIPGQYSRTFYNFTITSETQFNRLNEIYEQRKAQVFSKMQHQEEIVDSNEFSGAVIAQCRYETTSIDERAIFSNLLNVRVPREQIRSQIMKPSDQEKQLGIILQLQKSLYDKCWKIYKIRMDKALPNNVEVARRIQESIRDGITEAQIIRKNTELHQLKQKFLRREL